MKRGFLIRASIAAGVDADLVLIKKTQGHLGASCRISHANAMPLDDEAAIAKDSGVTRLTSSSIISDRIPKA
jgi:hypothetical protein